MSNYPFADSQICCDTPTLTSFSTPDNGTRVRGYSTLVPVSPLPLAIGRNRRPENCREKITANGYKSNAGGLPDRQKVRLTASSSSAKR